MKQKISSFAAQAKNNDFVRRPRQKKSASYSSCSLDHDLDSSKQFLRPYGRKTFVMSKRLCFGYAPDHNVNRCPKKENLQEKRLWW